MTTTKLVVSKLLDLDDLKDASDHFQNIYIFTDNFNF